MWDSKIRENKIRRKIIRKNKIRGKQNKRKTKLGGNQIRRKPKRKNHFYLDKPCEGKTKIRKQNKE